MFRPELVSFLKTFLRKRDPKTGLMFVEPSMRELTHATLSKFPGLFDLGEDQLSLTREGEVVVKWLTYVPPKAAEPEKDEEGDDGEE